MRHRAAWGISPGGYCSAEDAGFACKPSKLRQVSDRRSAIASSWQFKRSLLARSCRYAAQTSFQVACAGSWKSHKNGETVITEGELDNSFFVIAAGEVDVIKGKSVLGTLGTGDCFGEMGYLNKSKRSASVRAKGNVTLLRINATLMERASNDCQLRFYKMFTHTLIERLSRTNERLLAAGL